MMYALGIFSTLLSAFNVANLQFNRTAIQLKGIRLWVTNFKNSLPVINLSSRAVLLLTL